MGASRVSWFVGLFVGEHKKSQRTTFTGFWGSNHVVELLEKRSKLNGMDKPDQIE